MAGTRTYNVIKKLSDSFDALLEKLKKCVYTDSKAQLRSLTLAEADGTVHDSPIGTFIRADATSGDGATLPDDAESVAPLVVGSITLSPGTWVISARGRINCKGTSGDVCYLNISTSNTSKGKAASAWCAGGNAGQIGACINFTETFVFDSTVTYYLLVFAQNSTTATEKTFRRSGSFIEAVRIA